jgi:hypothetical protein
MHTYIAQIVKVPGMGDSITEGSVLEFKKSISNSLYYFKELNIYD